MFILSACERVGVVSESRWRQLEQSVSNVTGGSEGELELKQTAAQLLSVIRSVIETVGL